MKQFLISSLLLLGCYFMSFSQQKQFEFGLHSGVNFNSARGYAFTGFKPGNLFGVHFGFDIHYKFSENFGVKAMPQIDQNGWAHRSLYFEGIPPSGPLQKGDALTRLAYLNLPVLATFTTGSRIKFTAGAGFFGGYLLEELLVIKADKSSGSTLSGSSSSSENYKSYNYGLSFNAGVIFPMSKRLNFQAGMLDNFGLANINKSGETIKTNALSAMVGMVFLCK